MKHAQPAARLDKLLRALGVTTACVVTDLLGGIHAFVPYHLAPLVLMFLRRECLPFQSVRVSSLNVLLMDDE